MKKIILLLLILSLFNQAEAQKKKKKDKELIGVSPSGKNWIDGEWLGIGFQISSQTSWSLTFRADMKNKKFTIEYPSLECSGYWELVSIDNNIAQFQEIITDGMQKCVNGSIMIITRIDKSHITYSCFSPVGGKLDAYCTLVNINNLKGGDK